MMMTDQAKTCFVICPIGDEGSDVRKNADDLLELVIEPALETFGFNIVRADKISTPSMITNDIVKLVQESELCVVDLTGHNPNVYYECGRRHENGKPTIQLIQKGDRIPFDVAGIRTISYELTDARTIRETVLVVREFVKPFESAGYVLSTSGSSLTSMAESIDRIERQITRLVRSSSLTISENSLADRNDFLLKGPKDTIWSLLRSGDIDGAEQLFQKLSHRLPLQQFEEVGSALCFVGSAIGKNAMQERLSGVIDDVAEDDIQLFIGSICQYYVVSDLHTKGLEELSGFFEFIIDKKRSNNRVKATVYWQKSRLFHGTGDRVNGYEFASRAAESDAETYSSMFQELTRPTEMNT